jgi:hypothetical protein
MLRDFNDDLASRSVAHFDAKHPISSTTWEISQIYIPDTQKTLLLNSDNGIVELPAQAQERPKATNLDLPREQY